MAKKQQKKISKIQRSDFHLKLVHDISEMVNQAEGLETILQGVIKRIHDSLTFNVVSIYLWDEAKGELVMRANQGLKIDLKKPFP